MTIGPKILVAAAVSALAVGAAGCGGGGRSDTIYLEGLGNCWWDSKKELQCPDTVDQGSKGAAALENVPDCSPDCQGEDLRGADLTKADLSGVNLTGVDLTGADLRGANLSDANLSNVILDTALLNGATMPDGTVHK